MSPLRICDQRQPATKTKPETQPAVTGINQKVELTHDNLQYCTDVYSDLEKLLWQHKSLIFTQVFILFCRSHRKLLTFRHISHHTNHKLLCYWASTHLLRPHRKLLTQRFLSVAQTQKNYHGTTATRFHINKSSQHGWKSYIYFYTSLLLFHSADLTKKTQS